MRIGLSLKLSEPKYNVLAQNIQALFADGSQGWWYDDDDTTTLFQDSAGTTPVTAVEQFVGLQLDKSRGLVLGPELVTNGDFSQGSTGWSLGATTAIVNNAAVSTATPSGSNILQQSGLQPGAQKFVRISFDISGWSGGNLRIFINNNVYNLTGSNGAKSFILLSTDSSGSGLLIRAESSNFTGTIDNISVRELPGNHRYAPASGNRPIWSKRVNLLTKTEQFDDAVWNKGDASVTANTTIAPNGTNTADTLVENGITGRHFVYRLFNTVSGTTYTLSIQVKNLSRRYVALGLRDIASFSEPSYSAVFDLVNGVATTSTSSGSPSNTSSSIVSLGNGWFQLAITMQAVSTQTFIEFGLSNSATPSYSGGMPFYTGDGTSGIFVWGADLRPANQATGLLPLYQRVNTSTDYDTNGFPGYLKADGVDDFLQTNSIDFNTVTSDGLPRRNLLDNPTQFDTATWVKSNATVTANATTAPNGASTAYAVVEDGTTNTHRISTNVSVTSGVAYTISIYVKKDNIRYIQLAGSQPTFFPTGNGAWFDLDTGTASAGTSTTAAMLNIGNGWYRCAITVTAVGTGTNTFYFNPSDTNTTAVYTGVNGRTSVFLWGAQLETGSTATAFQNIGTDKITLCAGLRKLSDAARAMVTELGADVTQSFQFNAPSAAATTYSFASRGSAAASSAVYSNSAVAAPITNVATGIGDISGDSAILRINGTQVAASTTDQGTGNYGNLPAYFFHRNTSPATLRFNGNEYGNIAVGKLLTADQLTALETYMNGLTKAY